MLRYVNIAGLDIAGWAPLDCVIRQNHLGKLRTALGVAISIVGIGSLAGFVRRVSKSRRVTLVAKYTEASSLFLIYAYFISICSVIFATFTCIEFSNGSRYLRQDLSVSCDTAQYARHRALAVIGVLAFVAGVPVMIVVLLWPHRAVLSTPELARERAENDNIRSLGFLWRNVRRRRRACVCLLRLSLTPPCRPPLP